MFEIEENKSIAKGSKGELENILADMKIGHSFFAGLSDDDRIKELGIALSTFRNNIVHFGRRNKKHFATSMVTRTKRGIRVKRVE